MPHLLGPYQTALQNGGPTMKHDVGGPKWADGVVDMATLSTRHTEPTTANSVDHINGETTRTPAGAENNFIHIKKLHTATHSSSSSVSTSTTLNDLTEEFPSHTQTSCSPQNSAPVFANNTLDHIHARDTFTPSPEPANMPAGPPSTTSTSSTLTVASSSPAATLTPFNSVTTSAEYLALEEAFCRLLLASAANAKSNNTTRAEPEIPFAPWPKDWPMYWEGAGLSESW